MRRRIPHGVTASAIRAASTGASSLPARIAPAPPRRAARRLRRIEACVNSIAVRGRSPHSPPSPPPVRSADGAQDEHLGRAELALRRRDRHVRARSRKADQRPLQDPELLFRRARRRARVDRSAAARHARPHDDIDGTGAELRARHRDPRHSVPVPRLRACARRARRADRPGNAAEVRTERHSRRSRGARTAFAT